MIRRPPRSTLFPSRRSSDLWFSEWTRSYMILITSPTEMMPTSFSPRSEEHTSELQSRGHLVCRLLLEKKKNVYSNSGSIPPEDSATVPPADQQIIAIRAAGR